MTERIAQLITDVPDFPKPGIVFKDITPVLADPEGLNQAISAMVAPFRDVGVNRVACIESRGFIFGVPMAQILGVGAVLVRKPGKLPRTTRSVEYELEYGTDRIEMHVEDVRAGDRVLIVDDLLATGGTMAAAVKLVRQSSAEVVGVSVLIELAFLSGRARLLDVPHLHSVLQY